jgi:dCTP deaminase
MLTPPQLWTLDPTLRIFKPTAPGLSVAIDPGLPGYKAKDLLAGVTEPLIIPETGWDLAPGRLVLGWTAKESNSASRAG